MIIISKDRIGGRSVVVTSVEEALDVLVPPDGRKVAVVKQSLEAVLCVCVCVCVCVCAYVYINSSQKQRHHGN